jgi:hypothetical protein
MNSSSSSSTTIALIETREGWNMKILLGYLQLNLPTATFVADLKNKTLSLQAINLHNNMALLVHLDNFSIFNVNPEFLNNIEKKKGFISGGLSSNFVNDDIDDDNISVDEDNDDNMKNDCSAVGNIKSITTKVNEEDEDSKYKFQIGFTTKKLFVAISKIKKKQIISFSIIEKIDPKTESVIYVLGIGVKNNIQESIPIISKQLYIENYETYGVDVNDIKDYTTRLNCDKQELSNIIDSLNGFGNLVTISGQSEGLLFEGDQSDLYAKSSAKIGVWNEKKEVIYKAQILTSQFKKMKKCCSYNLKSFNIYFSQDKPLLFSFILGEVGTKYIYLAEKTQ